MATYEIECQTWTANGLEWISGGVLGATLADGQVAAHRRTLISRRKDQNLALSADGMTLEFDTYRAGYWDRESIGAEERADLQSLRTRATFSI